MTECANLLCHVKHLPIWMLAGSLSALTAVAGWVYLKIIKLLPWINLLVLPTGLTLLVLGTVNAAHASQVAPLDSTAAFLPVLFATGIFLLALGGVGRVTIRRHLAKESLRRQLWDRVSER